MGFAKFQYTAAAKWWRKILCHFCGVESDTDRTERGRNARKHPLFHWAAAERRDAPPREPRSGTTHGVRPEKSRKLGFPFSESAPCLIDVFFFRFFFLSCSQRSLASRDLSTHTLRPFKMLVNLQLKRRRRRATHTHGQTTGPAICRRGIVRALWYECWGFVRANSVGLRSGVFGWTLRKRDDVLKCFASVTSLHRQIDVSFSSRPFFFKFKLKICR